jgi:hypothetical protein
VLPHGLTPVDAGRLGLWLLGQRNHRRAVKRRERRYRTRVYPIGGLVARWARICAPWYAYEYPGAEILLMRVCGISEATAEDLLARSDASGRLSVRNARKLADYVERFDGPAVARELRAYADERDRRLARPAVGRKRVR